MSTMGPYPPERARYRCKSPVFSNVWVKNGIPRAQLRSVLRRYRSCRCLEKSCETRPMKETPSSSWRKKELALFRMLANMVQKL